MTTIAYDGKTLSVDSLASSGHITSRTHQKLFLGVGEFSAVAVCGSTAVYHPIVAWLKAGADPEAWSESWDAAAWCVQKSGEVVRYVSGYPEDVTSPDSDGSGGEYAIGAMIAGASATRAVEISASLDPFTGGDIRTFDIESARAAA